MSSLVDRLLHRYSLAHFNKQLDLWRAAAKDVEITYAKRSRNLIAGTTTMAFIHPAIDSFCIWRHAANDDENRWEEVGLVMSPTHPPAATDLTTFSRYLTCSAHARERSPTKNRVFFVHPYLPGVEGGGGMGCMN
ncbi:hypothetical protein OPV22_012176 [Ensete ventricosum]|uniref:Uncharacterized protein n=1 Tax=Ensete ventricosum TaxID=4639 RepID=A0AAV8QWH8_ENSVE|nr:hypothetical protein OPV22_012176 [Ensete ventricosum]